MLWDARSGQLLGLPYRHDDWTHEVGFSSDSKTIFTASEDGSARVWSIPPVDEQPVVVVELTEGVNPDAGVAVDAERLLEDPDDPVGQTEVPDTQRAIGRLADREQKIKKITQDIVLGKNQ